MEPRSKKQLNIDIRAEIGYLLRQSSHPKIHMDIDVVWVFSGPGTFFEPLKVDDSQSEAWMDRYRILYGISLVKMITAKRLGKSLSAVTMTDIESHGPVFFYNGTSSENSALREAVLLKKILPEHNVLIVDSVEIEKKQTEIKNTLDQVRSFPFDLLQELTGGMRRIALVSHLTHIVRILRYIEKYQLIPSDMPVEVFPLAAGEGISHAAVQEEVDKIWEYFQKGDLAWDPFPATV